MKNSKINYWIVAGIKKDYNFDSEFVLQKISEILKLDINDIKGKGKKREFVEARYIYSFIMKQKTDYTLSKIAKAINRKHDIIIYYNKMFQMISGYDKNLFNNYYKIFTSIIS